MNRNNDEELYRIRNQMEKLQQDIEENDRNIHVLSDNIDELYDIKRNASQLLNEMIERLKVGRTSTMIIQLEEERQQYLRGAITEHEYALEEAKEYRNRLKMLSDDCEEEYRRIKGNY